MHLTSRFALGAAGAAVAGAVVLAACGGSGTSHTAAPVAARPASNASATPTVTTKRDAKLGTILADAHGLTLYTLTNSGRAVDCTGGCQAIWPPLTATAGAMPSGASGVGTLGTTSLSDGTVIVTAGGLPVYRFAEDEDSGDAYGEGMATFGGVWHVVHTGQGTASAAPAAPARTSGGY